MRTLRVVIVAVVVAACAGAAVLQSKNPESVVLDSAERTSASGKFVTLASGTTHYEMAGPDSARTVVLVHGFSVPLYIWDSTFKALTAAGLRVLRYDVYGRGFSDRPDVRYDGELFDSQLGQLLDSLHITQPVDLVGLSYGGFITSHYVAGHAMRVRTLTLVDPVSSARSVPTMFNLPLVGAWLWQGLSVPGMADGQSSDFLHPEHFPGWADKYRPQMKYKGFGRALLRTIQSTRSVNFDTLYFNVSRTGIPVLLIWGKQDQTVNFEMSKVARTNIPAIEFFPIDSSGHLPHIEQTAITHKRMLEFFAEHAPPK